jgi:UrcA family protein
MNTNIKLSVCASTTLWAALLLAAPTAFAGDAVRSTIVKFTDLNLHSPAGVQTLYARIHSGAERVCSESVAPLRQIAAAACARKSEADAVQRLNLPQLTAYYQVKSGNYAQPLTANR